METQCSHGIIRKVIMQDPTTLIFYVAVLIFSIVIHEVAHGYVAYRLGDPTARFAGRLTLNPLKHIDPFGSIILPAILILTHVGFVVGWAKPVPYIEENLRNHRFGSAMVAAAGALSNFLLAIVFGLFIRIAMSAGFLSAPLFQATSLVVFVNLVLGIFNLIPIPPLDGSKILFSLLPRSMYSWRANLERYGLFFLLFFIVFLSQYLLPVIDFLFKAITGVSV